MTPYRHVCVLSAVLAGLSWPAHAIEMDYITYNGFNQVVSAFQYIAFFFSNTDYGGIVFVAAVLGLAAGAVSSMVRQNREDGTIRNWLLMFMVGAGLFIAFIVPRGTIHVYDRTLNAYQPVAGVPDGIILVAGLTNLIEVIGAEIANASSPVPYENNADGLLFKLINNTFQAGPILLSEYFWENIKTYYIGCGQVASVLPGTGFNLDELNRNSTDLLVTFASAQSEAVEIPWRTQANPAGTMRTCTDAYTDINTALMAPGNYLQFTRSLCSSVGFDMADFAQRGRCFNLMDEIVPTVFGQTGDRVTYLRSVALALAMQEAAADIDPSRSIAAETNRSMITQAAGLLTFASQYGQSIRAGFLAAAMSTLPLIMLFLVTPLRFRVLSLSVGFFVFVTLWGVIDIGLQSVLMGIAYDAFEDVHRNNLAFDAIMLTPPASVKALNVFGTSRLISISLASTIVILMFRFSGYSFGQLTVPFGHRGEDIGNRSAEARLNPERLSEGTASRAQAAGSFTGMAAVGPGSFQGMAASRSGTLVQELGRHEGFVQRGASQGFTGHALYGMAGVATGGQAAGRVEGVNRQAGPSVTGISNTTAETGATGAEREILDAQAFEQQTRRLAEFAGISQDQAKSLMTSYGPASEAGRVSSYDGDMNRAFQTVRVTEAQRIGAAEGVSDAAMRAGMTPEQSARAESFMGGLRQTGAVRQFEQAPERNADTYTRAGAVDVTRTVGAVRGLETTAQRQAQSPETLAQKIASLDAQDHGERRMRESAFAKAYGLEESDLYQMSNGGIEVAINDRSMQAFGSHMTNDQWMAAQTGGAMSVYFDPESFEIGRMDVRSGRSGTQDDTVHFLEGQRVDARQGTDGGQTLFRFAELAEAGHFDGVSKFARLLEKAEAEGTTASFSDSLAQQTSGYLNAIAGKDISYLSSDSDTGTKEAYARASVGTGAIPFLKLFGNLEAGGSTSRSFADIDSSQLVNRYDFWNDQTQQLWGRTIGSEAPEGTSFDRSQAFLEGLNDLRDEAGRIREWTKGLEYDDEQNVNGENPSDEKTDKIKPGGDSQKLPIERS
ncbi:conjugal transfer protein TraG N-terminal domain-containing protein [Eilatimonas milleporae]|uniref:TraG-like protein n=1 Tax=Eilatimonas milleporae TaxID=911205 RepID=A0A3M0C839_9PROT|nr:conjugal transfer protein TraG N-terminal domain-containing protein [Eilatimonas milleporae]RMB05055.1 TraG-like protein [Eilatimonas milleporae]